LNRKEKYDAYIKSPEWRRKRLEFINQHPTKKCFCGTSKKLHVHHATYDRLGNENFGDLRLVCEPCHDMIHYYHKNAGLPHTLEEATDNYIKMWLDGNEPKIDIAKNNSVLKGVFNVVNKGKKKNNKKHQNKSNVSLRRAGNRESKAKRIKKLLETKTWEEMTKKEKQLVDSQRYKEEDTQTHILSAKGREWNQLTNKEKKAVDRERYMKEQKNNPNTTKRHRAKVEKDLRRARQIVAEERKRIANGLSPSKFEESHV
jgi:hypothetical protein